MKKIFSRIKEEAFFVWRLFDPRHTPACVFKFACYVQYFKNRFFGTSMLKNMPAYKYNATDDLEIHTLCSKRDLFLLAWSLRSFLYYSGLRPRIIIHNDGSIDKKYAGLIRSKFDNLKVLSKDEVGQRIKTVAPPIVNSYREGSHPMMVKLIDIFYTANAANIMLMDSDILFFKEPQEIVDFLKKDELKALVSGATDGSADGICAGLLIFKKDLLKTDTLVRYLETQPDKKNFFVEQNGWDYIIRQSTFNFLPLDTYKIKNIVDDKTIMKHFTRPRRHEMYAYGIDMVRKKIEKQYEK